MPLDRFAAPTGQLTLKFNEEIAARGLLRMSSGEGKTNP